MIERYTNKDKFVQFLCDANACSPAVLWCNGKTLRKAWKTCHNPEWMDWLIVGLNLPKNEIRRISASLFLYDAKEKTKIHYKYNYNIKSVTQGYYISGLNSLKNPTKYINILKKIAAGKRADNRTINNNYEFFKQKYYRNAELMDLYQIFHDLKYSHIYEPDFGCSKTYRKIVNLPLMIKYYERRAKRFELLCEEFSKTAKTKRVTIDDYLEEEY